MSSLLRLYLGFSQVSGPIWRLALAKRLKKGKEDPSRQLERMAQEMPVRPKGQVFWFHALSVGESLALIPLIELALGENERAHVVLTTSTVTSITALDRAGLPSRCIHTMLPIDTAAAARRFLEHWQPAVAVFAELDFWPRIMTDTHRRKVPMVLVNSRMSDKSLASRARLGGMMTAVLRYFDALLIQDDASRDRFVALGAVPDRVRVIGALKAAARPLPCEKTVLEEFEHSIGARQVWHAAATHPSEHAAILEAHQKILLDVPGALLIVSPRYSDSGDDLENKAKSMFNTVSRRTKGEAVKGDTAVYIADTIGEMGLWYRLAAVSFIGHSLPQGESGGGGKNPYEAIALGSAVLTGPEVSDFLETYQRLEETGAALTVQNADALSQNVQSLFDADLHEKMTSAAKNVVEESQNVLKRTWDEIARHL